VPQDGRDGSRRGQPAGIDRAREQSGKRPPVPLRRQQAGSAPVAPEPEWPPGATVDLPRGVLHELRNQVRGGRDLVDQVAKALTIGGDAIDDGQPEIAVTYLEWAKHQAPRSSAIREALGIASYLTEDYASAITELQAYKRMTGHRDQNHVLADCVRAADGDTSRIGELVGEMDAARDGVDRYTEGIIVWASALADAGDVGAGRAVLRRALEGPAAGRVDRGSAEEHDLRLWYVAGDLAQRAGEADQAEVWFARVAAHTGDYFDVEQRLRALRG